MRPEKDLEQMIAAALVVANGTGKTPLPVACPVDIVARDDEERLWLLNRLKGKHHARSISVKVEARAA